MKELGRIVAYAAIAAVANVLSIWATAKVKEETMKTEEVES